MSDNLPSDFAKVAADEQQLATDMAQLAKDEAALSSALPAPAAAVVAALGTTPSALAFSDYFPGTSLDASKWIPWMADAQYGRWGNNGTLAAPLSAVGNSGGCNAEYDDPSQVVVNDGLTITAVPDSSQSGYTWRSGCICTEGLFSFGPGSLLRVTMQEPSEPGAWPAIWSLDGSAEVDLQEGGYLEAAITDANCGLAANYHGSGDAQTLKENAEDLTAGLHLYELAYSAAGVVTMFCDSVETASYSGVSGEFEVIIDLAVAQNTSGWHPMPAAGTSEMAMKVGAVEVWQ